MKISVITVCYNSAATIADTFASVAAQSHPDVEHIVIDGGSTDGTVDIIKRHQPQIAHWISEKDRGLYDAMNKGLQKANGDVVGFLNADDVYYDGRVLSVIAKKMSEENIQACFGDLVYVDPKNLQKIIRYWKSKPYKNGAFKYGWVPAHPTFYAQKNVYLRHGGFDLSYQLASDFDIMCRFIEKHHIKTKYISQIFVRMRTQGETNKSIANIIKQNIEIVKSMKKNGANVAPGRFIVSKLASRIVQYVTSKNAK